MVPLYMSRASIVSSSARFHQASLLYVYKQDELGITTPLDLNLISSWFGHYPPDPRLVRTSSRLLRSVTLLVLSTHHMRSTRALGPAMLFPPVEANSKLETITARAGLLDYCPVVV